MKALGNIGLIDISANNQSVTLRIRHLIDGRPGATLAHGEVRKLIARLERALAEPSLPDDERTAPADDVEDLIG